MDEKPNIRQKYELLSLKGIFYDCLEDLTEGNKKKPIDIRINLLPSKGSIRNFEILVEVCLHVTCPPSYPEELPNFKLENNKGLTPENLKQLNQELLELAKQKKGTESIFDLCQCVKDFLYNLNKELLIQKENEEDKREAERREKEREQRELDAELARRLSKPHPKPVVPSLSPVERRNSSEENNEVCSHESVCSISLGSRQILRGKCLEHFGLNHSVHLGIDEESGKNYTIHEWKLDSNLNQEQVKQIRAIEQEFNSSIKTLKHENLVSYYNISLKRHEDHNIIHTVEEQINGYNCNTLLVNCNIRICFSYTRHIARKVLEALDYLHSKNIVHRDLSGSCIFIDNRDVVKVGNYATYRRLSDLVGNKLNINYNKKKDIEKFGNFVYSLFSGVPIYDDAEVNIPISLPPELYEFLKMCKDDEQQCTAADLLKHQFLNRNTLHLEHGEDESEIPEDNFNIEMQRRNLIRNTSTSDQSRISSEFELIKSLGKGAFGSVHKYKNLLDERFYAIKKIQLNTKSKHTIKKIKNEVKLLSRLHHTNVVRYYTSWIEEVEGDDRPSSCETVSSEQEDKVKYIHKHDELTQYDDIEKLAPPISKNRLSTTYSHLQSQSLSDTDSSDEDEDITSDSKKSESDGIVFENSENVSNVNEEQEQYSTTSEKKSFNLKKTYMYIQMEFCEKSTLRSAIDTTLCTDEDRILRHFRQILDGLHHIHNQGMIHRDLKPANIFLDLRDSVKIGDFGLATRNLKSKLNEDSSQKTELDYSNVGESTTGQVGTFFYVAPEVCAKGKVVYNTKVDIYSLGIILFEMCYKPITTGMERYSVLQELRKKDIKFPEDHKSTFVKKYHRIIRKLLDHDVSKRPTVSEILESEDAPPPVLEERGLYDTMNYIIADPKSNVYQSLTAKLFKQKLPLIKDLTYDHEESYSSFIKSLTANYELVKTIAVKVFTNHGAKNMFTPHFMPFSNAYSFQNKENCVKLMTHGGDIVSIPCDLRVHFARYVAWNSLYLVKRYSIERVYHEQKVFGVSPEGFYECAFDIVTPTQGKNLLPDGEVLHAVYEVLSQLPELNNENVVIHLNHTSLLKAILLYFAIEPELHSKIIEIFYGHETKLSDLDLERLVNLKILSSQQINHLTGIFFSKNEAGKMPNIVKTILNSSKAPKAREYCEEAKQELTKIIKVAEAMGVEFGICIIPGLMYNVQQFSGMICKFLYKNSTYKHGRMETLAAGGRYDSMITHYRNLFKGTHLAKNISQSAVGVSIFLDKVVQVLQRRQAPGDRLKFSDVLVCLQEEWPLHRVVMVLKNLSSLHIQWMLFQTNSIEEADAYSEDLGIPQIIMLLNGYNENSILLKSWNEDRSRYKEKKCTIGELVEELNRTVRRGSQTSDSALVRSESKTYVEKQHNDSLTIVFHTSVNSKKRMESQINSKLDDFRERYHGPIVVLAFNLDTNIIKMLAASLDFESEKSFQKSMKNVVERNSKQKALQEVCELIYDHKSKSNKPFVILYSLTESSFRYI